MKMYVQKEKVVFVGKAWQIKYMINKNKKRYSTVKELIDGHNSQNKLLQK